MLDPFLKWAGGKRWMAASGQLPLPPRIRRYAEPFVGGGAIFFRLLPETSILSDVNPELINLYQTVRDNPAELTDALKRHQALHNTDHYYHVRAVTETCPIAKAARMLYLNRTCWNGLYRVNRNGAFNVPIGTKNRVIFDGEDFQSFSIALRNTDLRCCDFSLVLDSLVDGDFAFVDPPYTVQHNYNGFVKYNESLFSWEDQIRLEDCCRRAASRGVALVITNADHQSLRDLYSDKFEYKTLKRASVLAGTNGRRGPTTEALFTANIAW